MELTFRQASADDCARLAALAAEIWQEHYAPLIGAAQVAYMLEHFQSEDAIARQMREEGYEYYLIEADGAAQGYIGIKPDGTRLFLSKLYLRRAARGKGLGGRALDFVKATAAARGYRAVWLTCNKYNEASLAAYRRKGFVVTDSAVTEIGGGYAMDDYFLECPL